MTELNLDIPDSGAVFVFGKNVPSRFYIKNDTIVSASCGEGHAVVVTETGRVFSFGSNDYGQLGLGTSNSSPKPACVKTIKSLHEKAIKVACGIHQTLILTESGNLYGCGNNSDQQLFGTATSITIPILLENVKGKSIRDMTAGRSFCAILTRDGELCTWGSNSEGCLGCGKEAVESETNVATKVNIPGQVIAVSAGTYHIGCVTADGAVFLWGETELGKLGFLPDESEEYVYDPRKLELGQPASSIACGQSHTLVLMKDGSVLSFGAGDCGQLGLGQSELSSDIPKKVVALEGIQIMNISAGEDHSAAVSNDGRFFTFGNGSHGKLGPTSSVGSFSNQFRPFRVTAVRKLKVRRVLCGSLLTLILTVPRPDGDSGYTGSESEEDNPMLCKTAMSPRPLNRTMDEGGIQRRPSLLAREKRRQESLASTQSMMQIPELELTRPKLNDQLLATAPAKLDNNDTKIVENGFHRPKVPLQPEENQMEVSEQRLENGDEKPQHVMAVTKFDNMLEPQPVSDSEEELNDTSKPLKPVQQEQFQDQQPVSLNRVSEPPALESEDEQKEQPPPPPKPKKRPKRKKIAIPQITENGEQIEQDLEQKPKRRASNRPSITPSETFGEEIEEVEPEKKPEVVVPEQQQQQQQQPDKLDEPDPTLAKKPMCGGRRKVPPAGQDAPTEKPTTGNENAPSSSVNGDDKVPMENRDDPTVAKSKGCGSKRSVPAEKPSPSNEAAPDTAAAVNDNDKVPIEDRDDPTVAKSNGCGSKRSAPPKTAQTPTEQVTTNADGSNNPPAALPHPPLPPAASRSCSIL